MSNIYEVYHWDQTTKYDPISREGGLFSKYINTVLKFKQQSSVPPDWIGSEKDMDKYVDEYLEKEWVQLDREYIKKNSGLRALNCV